MTHPSQSSITEVQLALVGVDGNAFAILGAARRALQGAGLSSMWPDFERDATAGDYSHLLATCAKWFDVV